jgi:UDP:flavonoid glycosyltransferase YjiC (YdhE family)
LLAGKPSIVVPHAADQFYWADLLRARGVATKSMPAKSLTVHGLAGRLRAVHERPEMGESAKTLGDALREERGPERAAELIERAMSRA